MTEKLTTRSISPNPKIIDDYDGRSRNCSETSDVSGGCTFTIIDLFPEMEALLHCAVTNFSDISLTQPLGLQATERRPPAQP